MRFPLPRGWKILRARAGRRKAGRAAGRFELRTLEKRELQETGSKIDPGCGKQGAGAAERTRHGTPAALARTVGECEYEAVVTRSS